MEPGARHLSRLRHFSVSLTHGQTAPSQPERPGTGPGRSRGRVRMCGFTEAGRLPHGLERVLGKGPKGDRDEDSLLSDELAIHGDQAEVHLEEVLEHTQLLPQVTLALRVVSVDGNEQAFSKLQVEGAGISQRQGTPHLA